MGTVTLWLREAKNLMSADLNGKSDPYVVMKVSSGAWAKSKIVKVSLFSYTLHAYSTHAHTRTHPLALAKHHRGT